MGYTKRAIYDAMGWDMQSTPPLARWALVGPPIVPRHSIAGMLVAMAFILVAIVAFVTSIGLRHTYAIMAPIDAIVAAYFGPFYLALHRIIGGKRASAASTTAMGMPGTQGVVQFLLFLAVVATLLAALEAWGAIHLGSQDSAPKKA